MSTLAIRATLADFGIWITDRDRRHALAEELSHDGATADDVETIGRYVERTAGHDLKVTGPRLAKVLKPGVWRDALRAAQAAEERLPGDPAPKPGEHDHGATRRAEDDAARRARQGEAGLAGGAFCGVWFRESWAKTPADIARELDVDPARLPELVQAGARAYGQDPDEALERFRSLAPKEEARR